MKHEEGEQQPRSDSRRYAGRIPPVLTDKGRRAFDAAMDLQAPWVSSLAEGLAVKDLQTVHRVILTLRKRLEGGKL